MAKEVNQLPFLTYLGDTTIKYGGSTYVWNGRYYVMQWGLFNPTSNGTTPSTTAEKGSVNWFLNGGAEAISTIVSSIGSLVSGLIISKAQANYIKNNGNSINVLTGESNVVQAQSNMITFVAIGLAGVVVILLIRRK